MRYGLTVACAVLGWLVWSGMSSAGPAEIESQFVKVYESARPSVVMITTRYRQEMPGTEGLRDLAEKGPFRDIFGPREVSATYSGVVLDGAGHILTVAGAVQNAVSIEVTTWDGRREKAQPVGADDRSGLGVLKIPPSALKPLPMGDSSALKVGCLVAVIGNPFGLQGSFSYGIVSGLGRKIEEPEGLLKNMIQMTAPINPGDAGGAVVNLEGRLIGLVHSTFGRAPSLESIRAMLAEGRQWIGWGRSESPFSADGINFAIPIADAKPLAEEIIATGRVTRGWLGMRIEDVRPQPGEAAAKAPGGVRVALVLAGSPAAAAGLRVDDRVLALNGRAVKNVEEFVETISRSAVGSQAQLSIIRDNKELAMSAVVGKQPETEEAYRRLLKDVSPLLGQGGQLGVLVQEVSPQMAEYLQAPHGVLVMSVVRGSAAERSGIRNRDVIAMVEGAPVRSIADLRHVVSQHADALKVEVYRNGEKLPLEVKLKQP